MARLECHCALDVLSQAQSAVAGFTFGGAPPAHAARSHGAPPNQRGSDGPAGARCSHRSFRVAEGQRSSAVVPWINYLRHNGHAGRRAHDGAAEQRGPQERCWPRFGVGLLLRSSLRAIGRPSFSPTSARSNFRPPRSRRSAQPCPPTSTSESEPGCFNKHRVFVDYSLGSWLVSEASGTIINCDSQFAKYQ